MAHIEVDLEVGEGLQCSLYLHVLGACGGGRCAHTVGTQQPSSVLGPFDIGIAHQTEAEVQARREHMVGPLALSQHVTHIGQEARQGQVVCVAIAHAHVSHHHQQTGTGLCPCVPLGLLPLGQGDDIEAQLGGVGRIVLDAQGGFVHTLVAYLHGMARTVEGRHAQAVALLVVLHHQLRVGEEDNLLHKSLHLAGGHLLGGHALGIGLLPAGQNGVEGDARLLALLPGLLQGFGLGLLLFAFGLIVAFLLLHLLVGLASGIGGREAFVGLLQEAGVVVEGFQSQTAIEVDGALGIDVVAQRAAALQFGSAFPRVVGRIGGIGRHPVEDGDAINRYLVAEL